MGFYTLNKKVFQITHLKHLKMIYPIQIKKTILKNKIMIIKEKILNL